MELSVTLGSEFSEKVEFPPSSFFWFWLATHHLIKLILGSQLSLCFKGSHFGCLLSQCDFKVPQCQGTYLLLHSEIRVGIWVPGTLPSGCIWPLVFCRRGTTVLPRHWEARSKQHHLTAPCNRPQGAPVQALSTFSSTLSQTCTGVKWMPLLGAFPTFSPVKASPREVPDSFISSQHTCPRRPWTI